LSDDIKVLSSPKHKQGCIELEPMAYYLICG